MATTAVTYAYDQAGAWASLATTLGRRTGMTDAGGSESWAVRLDGPRARGAAHYQQRHEEHLATPTTWTALWPPSPIPAAAVSPINKSAPSDLLLAFVNMLVKYASRPHRIRQRAR